MGFIECSMISQAAAIHDPFGGIPCATEQGIFPAEQGIKIAEQGIVGAETANHDYRRGAHSDTPVESRFKSRARNHLYRTMVTALSRR
jgi:hypothetical protein